MTAVRIFTVLLGIMFFPACVSTQETGLQIRIHNATGQDTRDFWLGSGGRGGPTRAFGEIDAGEKTGYSSIETHPSNYRKFNFIQADGEQHIGVLDEVVTAGRYTLRYALSNGEVSASLQRD